MKSRIAIATLGVFLGALSSGSAAARDVYVEQAASGNGYDFVVHVKNTPTYGYNPEVATDRARMAMRLVRGQCRRAGVVGQQTIDTEIYGLITGKPDYVVFVRCM